MSWDVAVYGELKLPRGEVAAWRKRAVDPSQLAGWPPDFTAFEPHALTVDALLARASSLAPALGFLTIDADAGTSRVRVRGHLVKDAYYEWAGLLAASFRCAAELGGEGALTFLGFMTIDFGYRVLVSPSGAKVLALDEPARRVADASPEIAEITAAAKRSR